MELEIWFSEVGLPETNSWDELGYDEDEDENVNFQYHDWL